MGEDENDENGQIEIDIIHSNIEVRASADCFTTTPGVERGER